MVAFEGRDFLGTHAPFAQSCGEQLPRSLDPKAFEKDPHTFFGVEGKSVYTMRKNRNKDPKATILAVALRGPDRAKAPINLAELDAAKTVSTRISD